ncbi:MAG: NmrA family NAD(P)-binding protein [Candidatus Zixiibacteriota bacterium]|nr:MAG: NmrA family NAD(P)-binding protein [candidate division Zixibacteria bacterium]
MIVITGATGNIGSKITSKLLNQGKKVRVIGRDAKRLQVYVDQGAEAFVGDLSDQQFLTRAFKGATVVFCMIPPNLTAKNVNDYQRTIGTSIVTAVKNAGVTHVVNLSSIGAHLTRNAGIVQGLHDQEERLNDIVNLNVVHLRPAFFMENLLSTIDMIKSQNMVGAPLDGAFRFPTVAIQDVANVACDYLTKATFTGHTVRNLLGQRDINYNEIVKVLGQAIGNKNLKYVQFPYEQAQTAMVNTGISDSVAAALTETMKTTNEGPFLAEAHRTPESSTPTSIEEWAKTFAKHYNL